MSSSIGKLDTAISGRPVGDWWTFAKGKWRRDGLGAQPGERLAIILTSWRDGNVLWKDSKIESLVTQRVVDDGVMLQRPPAGWSKYTSVMVVDKDGSIGTFTSSSWGGHYAISALISAFQMQQGRAFPICELEMKERGDEQFARPPKIRKPGKEFFRALPIFHYFNLYADIVEGKIDKDFYIVMPSMAAAMEAETFKAALVLCVNMHQIPFFWPVRSMEEDRANAWTESAHTAVKMAIDEWVKIRANQKPGAGYYDVFAAKGKLGEPEFPANDLASHMQLVKAAVPQERMTAFPDHPIFYHKIEGRLQVSALPYREIWLVDFEFHQPAGERPEPACLVALEFNSGRKIRLWRNQFENLPPYPLDEGSLFVAYFASAEMSCHRALDWPMPARVLDLFTDSAT